MDYDTPLSQSATPESTAWDAVTLGACAASVVVIAWQ